MINVIDIRTDRCHQCLETRECAVMELPQRLILCHACMGPFLVGQFREEPERVPVAVQEVA